MADQPSGKKEDGTISQICDGNNGDDPDDTVVAADFRNKVGGKEGKKTTIVVYGKIIISK